MRLDLTDYHSYNLSNVLHPVQGASIQDVNSVPSIDHNFGHSAVADEHSNDQSIIVREVHNQGFSVRERDWSAQS